MNVIPQWQSINNGNWKSIESAVRTKAASLGTDVIVYTGGYQVLKLENKKVTLENGGIEVPKWSWKILKVPSSNKGIAFVTLNNPFITSDPTPICKNICSSYNWDFPNRKIYEKGFTICCSIEDLMNEVSSIPSDAAVSNILNK